MRVGAIPSRVCGLSLVELMVAITLALILGAALIQIFVSSRSVYRMQEASGRLQESGRYAMEVLTREVRMAGYTGCASVDTIPVFVQASSPPADVTLNASNIIRGLDNVAAVNAYNAAAGTDVLIIRRAADSGVRLAGNMTADNANIQIVDNSAGFKAGDFLLISDCQTADLFCANNVSSGGTVTIAHSSSCNVTPQLSKAYGTEAEVLAFQSTAFFVRDTGRATTANNPIRALFMTSRIGSTVQTMELVEGVENLQVEYGLDTNSDRSPDEYRTAANITSNAQWATVVTARVSLLLHSVEENLVGTSGDDVQNLTYNGAAVAQDGRLRQVFGSVIAIRNRLP